MLGFVAENACASCVMRPRLEYTSYCRECRNKRANASYYKNREAGKRQRRSWNLKSKYGLTADQVDEMIVRQDGGCEICDADLSTDSKPAVDHDHETGQVRSILCHNCNSGLGLFSEEPMFLRAAADYLDFYQNP